MGKNLNNFNNNLNDPSQEKESSQPETDFNKLRNNPEMTSADIKRLDSYASAPEYTKRIISKKDQIKFKIKELSNNYNLDPADQIKYGGRIHTISFQRLDELEKELLQKEEQLKKEQANDKENSKEVDYENPEIQKTVTELKNYLSENQNALGKKAAQEFEQWAIDQIKRKPCSVKKAQDTFKGLKEHGQEGTEVRIKFYNNEVLPFFKKIGVNPHESKVINELGRSEKQAHIKNIKEQINHFDKLKSLGIYEDTVIKEEIKRIALADTPHEQKEMQETAIQIGKIEQENYTHLDTQTSIHGINFPAFRNKEFALKEHAKLKIGEKLGSEEKRVAFAKQWKKTIEAEKNLAHEFETDTQKLPDDLKTEAAKAYIDTPKYEDRIKLKDKYKKLAETAEKEKIEYELIKDQATGKIHSCDALSTKTKNNYVAFFKSTDNFRDDKTKKPGSLKIMKKAFQILTDKTPNYRYKNLAAYQERKKNFDTNAKKLDGIAKENKDLKTEIQNLSNEYEKVGWTKREQLDIKMNKLLKKHEEELKKNEELEEKINPTAKLDKKENIEKLKKEEVIKLAEEHLKFSNKEPKAALKLLLAFDDQEPGHEEIRFLIDQASTMLKEFGDKNDDDKAKNEITQEAEKLMDNDQTIKEEMTDHVVSTKATEAKKLGESQENKKETEQVALKKRVKALRAQGKEEEAVITEEYHRQSKDKILDKQGKSQKVETIKHGEKTNSQDRNRITRTTAENEATLMHNEVPTTIEITDKNNRVLSSDEAKALNKKKKQEIAQNVLDKSRKAYARKHTNVDAERVLGNLDKNVAANDDIEKKIDQEADEVFTKEKAA